MGRRLAGLSINQSVCIQPRAVLTPRTSRKFTVDGRSGRLYQHFCLYCEIFTRVASAIPVQERERSWFLTSKETRMHLIRTYIHHSQFRKCKNLPCNPEGPKLRYYCSLEATSVIEKFAIDDIACVTVMARNCDADQSGKRVSSRLYLYVP